MVHAPAAQSQAGSPPAAMPRLPPLQQQPTPVLTPSAGWRASAWSAGGAWRASWPPATQASSCAHRRRSCAAGSAPRARRRAEVLRERRPVAASSLDAPAANARAAVCNFRPSEFIWVACDDAWRRLTWRRCGLGRLHAWPSLPCSCRSSSVGTHQAAKMTSIANVLLPRHAGDFLVFVHSACQRLNSPWTAPTSLQAAGAGAQAHGWLPAAAAAPAAATSSVSGLPGGKLPLSRRRLLPLQRRRPPRSGARRTRAAP